jgi:hypothetical protein
MDPIRRRRASVAVGRLKSGRDVARGSMRFPVAIATRPAAPVRARFPLARDLLLLLLIIIIPISRSRPAAGFPFGEGVCPVFATYGK